MNVPELWPALLVSMPLAGAVLGFVRMSLGPPLAQFTALTMIVITGFLPVSLIGQENQQHSLGGWGPPLGIDWRLDAMAAVLLLLAALVMGGATLYRAAAERAVDFKVEHDLFWPLWLFLWASLNALFLSADLFNVYVALELVSLAGVGLIALNGGTALAAAWRYFLAMMLGSGLYLVGVALIYGQYGTLDMIQTADALTVQSTTMTGAALISGGLLLKAAIFPLHIWLPSAHGRASVPVSAALSGVVVAASFYLLTRLWLGPFESLLEVGPPQLFGVLGVAAIIWGGLLALVQRRLKMLIAYSTVSQLGYAMLVFPLAATTAGSAHAQGGMVILLLSHGLAKAALFLAAGCIVLQQGHDRLDRLSGANRYSALAWLAFALAGASMVGIPPSGGFLAKWWLLQSALLAEQWLWISAIILGGALTAAYLFRALEPAITLTAKETGKTPPLALNLAALMLAVAAWMVGLVPGAAESLLINRGEA